MKALNFIFPLTGWAKRITLPSQMSIEMIGEDSGFPRLNNANKEEK